MVGRLTGRPLHGFIGLLYEHPPKNVLLAFLRVKKKTNFISFYFIPFLPEIFRLEWKNYFFLRNFYFI